MSSRRKLCKVILSKGFSQSGKKGEGTFSFELYRPVPQRDCICPFFVCEIIIRAVILSGARQKASFSEGGRPERSRRTWPFFQGAVVAQDELLPAKPVRRPFPTTPIVSIFRYARPSRSFDSGSSRLRVNPAATLAPIRKTDLVGGKTTHPGGAVISALISYSA
jgi:hypothetical protein